MHCFGNPRPRVVAYLNLSHGEPSRLQVQRRDGDQFAHSSSLVLVAGCPLFDNRSNDVANTSSVVFAFGAKQSIIGDSTMQRPPHILTDMPWIAMIHIWRTFDMIQRASRQFFIIAFREPREKYCLTVTSLSESQSAVPFDNIPRAS